MQAAGTVRIGIVMQWAIAGIVVLSSVALLRPNASASACPEIVGRWPYGPILQAALSGDTAYTITGSVLQVVDLGDPTAPAVMGELGLGRAGGFIAVEGPFAYRMDGGLRVYDVSDPSAPAQVGFLDVDPWFFGEFEVSGGYVYAISRNPHGMGVIDVTDPSNPVLVTVYERIDWPIGIDVSGDHAFLIEFTGSYQTRLRVLSVQQPGSPEEVGVLEFSDDWPLAVEVAAGWAYVGTSSSLAIVDVSDPTDPDLVMQWPMSGFVLDVAVSGSVVFTSWSGSAEAVIALDVADPIHPVELARWGFPGESPELEVGGGMLLVAARDLVVVDIDDPGAMVIAGVFDAPGATLEKAVSGNFAFAAAHSELRVFDISDPSGPVVAGEFAVTGEVSNLATDGDLAVLGNIENGLQFVDFSDPLNLTVTGTYSMPYTAPRPVEFSGGHVYTSSYDYVVMIDVSDPADPIYVDGAFCSDTAYDLELDAGYLYAACFGDGLRIFETGQSIGLQPVGSIAIAFARGLAVVGTLVYLVDGDLRVIDATDPTAPVEIGFLDLAASGTGVTIAGSRAYVGSWSGLLSVVDVGDPSSPVLLRQIETPGAVGDADLAGGHLVVSNGPAGLTIIRGCQSFYDGFESGDIGGWAACVP